MRCVSELSTEALRALIEAGDVVLLLPVGSVEPHGPHLPLGTDTFISEAVAGRAAARLEEAGIVTLIGEPVSYGVTDYAAGFSGAISIPASVLTPFLRAVVDGYLQTGVTHVCLINNHLEPEHDAAVRAAIAGLDPQKASVACPLTRRWGRTLSDEYKSGACHAGRYETSLILACRPSTVAKDIAATLPSLATSLSKAMSEGQTTFAAMGLDRAYTGAPSEASPEEGADLLDRLATMVVTEVTEALAKT
jgi:creatinine amidohydrolase